MFSFYDNVAAAKCEEPEADMLLCQWGTYDWGDGSHFDISLVRQFYERHNVHEQGLISQLHLTFRYEPSAVFDAIRANNFWCSEHDELEAFVERCHATAAFEAVADKPAKAVIVRHEYV
jgi:hypothetical protein